MSETMIPTMSFRWLVPSFAAYGDQPDCRRLQQLHHTSTGDKWIDIRMVEEEFAAPTVGTAAGAPDPAPAPFKGTIADIWINGARSDT